MSWWLLRIALCVLLWPLLASPAHAQCSSPAGIKGEVIFSGDSNVPVYCDDTNWIAMVGANPEQVCPAGYSACGGKPSERLVFGTSNTAAASTWTDASCQSLADAAGIHGTYKVWYSTSANQDPESTFERSTVPYVMTNGIKIADDWIDLTDGSLDHRIDWDELNTQFSFFNVATDTNTDGTFDSAADITAGAGGQTDSRWTSNNVITGVTGSSAYCFEQGNIQQTQVVPNGLVGHWRLDETTGTLAADSSGNGNDATLTNADFSTDSIADGIVDRAVYNVNNNNHIGVSSTDFPTGVNPPFSYAIWLRNDSSGGAGQRYAFAYGGGGGESLDVQAWSFNSVTNQYDDIRVNINGVGQGIRGFGFPEEEWVHMAIVYDGTNLQFYRNGSLRTTYSSISFTPGATASLGIGSALVTNEWRGGRDDARFYNRVLTPEEVTEIYSARDGIRYNDAHRVPEYFDGNRFVAMSPAWPDVTTGLIGHWKLDEVLFSSAVDSSGNGNLGTLSGDMDQTTDSVPGAVGTALAFDGVDDGTEVASFAALDIPTTGSFSQFLWFKKDTDCGANVGADNEVMAMRYGSGFTNRTWWFGCTASSDALTIRFYGNSSSAIVTGPVIDDGQWHHGGWIYDADTGEVRLYLDGSEVNSQSYTLDSDMNLANPLCIGSYDAQCDDSRFYFRGELDDVRLYGRALSLAEIQTLYQMGAPVGSSAALPQGCPNIGDVCDDGTIYAGLSPDGNVPMFTTLVDAGSLPWNNANSSDYEATSAIDLNAGEGNTGTTVTIDSDSAAVGFQPHLAAQYCNGLASHGADDWYLPAREELRLNLCSNAAAIRNFTIAGYPSGAYWSSTESGATVSWFILMDSCAQGTNVKHASFNVRCVRKGPAPRCANPYGLEGAMMYNDDFNVLQYCDGARWLAIGKSGP